MTTTSIPSWNAQGVIPPINPVDRGSVNRSPYVVRLLDVVLRYGNTAERRSILSGFLRYREALHHAGLVSGFQWLDGSFLEHVEELESRAPRDIDVVTFYCLPAGRSQQDVLNTSPATFSHSTVKGSFKVDAYVVDLGIQPERLARWSAYWYSMWSHRRNDQWKGFLQVDLAPTHDSDAARALQAQASPTVEGGQP